MEEKMIRKLLMSSLLVAIILTGSTNAFVNAQTATSAADQSLTVSSDKIASRYTYEVKTGQTLNLEIKNYSQSDLIFEVPVMKIAVSVLKNSTAVVPLNFSNPPEKNVFFRIDIQDGVQNMTGSFIVTDYVKGPSGTPVPQIDTSMLNPIINFDKSFTYEDKPEPSYAPATASEPPMYSEPAAPQSKPAAKSNYVRGYW